MKERPIIFSASMVRALLEGRKTQTRRVVTAQSMMKIAAGLAPSEEPDAYLARCPYGKPGDQLVVREKWRKGITDSGLAVEYAADFARTYLDDYPDKSTDWYWLTDMPWKSPLFMPRWASRITLEITDVRIERLFDISQEDAEAEGVSIEETRTLTHRGAFAITWDRINKKRGYAWEGGTNPWVWALTFRKVTDAKHNDDRAS